LNQVHLRAPLQLAHVGKVSPGIPRHRAGHYVFHIITDFVPVFHCTPSPLRQISLYTALTFNLQLP
jgi:hypothetical protein